MSTDYFALERVLDQSGSYDDEYILDLTHKRADALRAEARARPREVCPFCREEFPAGDALETHVEWGHADE